MTSASVGPYINLRLQLAIRKTMLTIAERRIYREVLPRRWSWATRAQVEAVVVEMLRDGRFTEEKGRNGSSILVWHEENIK